MQITVASTAVENALRVNYSPVSFGLTVASSASKQGLVGYRENDERLAQLTLVRSEIDEKGNDAVVVLCIDERCIECLARSSLQGFGKETVVIKLKSAKSNVVLGQLLVTSLSAPLIYNQWIDVSHRESHIFRLTTDQTGTVPSRFLVTTFPIADVKYSQSPNGPPWSMTPPFGARKEAEREAAPIR